MDKTLNPLPTVGGLGGLIEFQPMPLRKSYSKMNITHCVVIHLYPGVRSGAIMDALRGLRMSLPGKVVTGRKWNKPEIYARVSADEIEMEISLDDFLIALSSEIGSPLLLLSREALKERIRVAASAVMAEVRVASKEVI